MSKRYVNIVLFMGLYLLQGANQVYPTKVPCVFGDELRDRAVAKLPADIRDKVVDQLLYKDTSVDHGSHIVSKSIEGMHSLDFSGYGLTPDMLHLILNHVVSKHHSRYVQFILIDNNKLDTLKPGTFNNMPNLLAIHLNNNKLKELSAGVFDNLKIKGLYLGNNLLGVLDKDIFKKWPNLVRLQLEGNNLTSLPKELFDKFGLLKYLFIDFDVLKSFDEHAFKSLKELKELAINDKTQEELPKKTVEELKSKLPNLKKLVFNQKKVF